MRSRYLVMSMAVALLLFITLVVSDTFQRYPYPWLYIFLLDLHVQLARLGLAAAALMGGVALYTGLIRKGDVTPLFRSAAYTVFATVLLSALMGAVMLTQNGRPREDAHLFYGAAGVLALPFFIFVETTAKKRPAMGVYVWGFALVIGFLLRAMMTGA